MALLTGKQILGAVDLPLETVQVPEWGGEVAVTTMTGAQRDAWESANVSGTGRNARVVMANIRARLAAATIVDENGKRVFTDKDAEALGKKSAAALDRVFAVAVRLNGLSEKDIEDLAGN